MLPRYLAIALSVIVLVATLECRAMEPIWSERVNTRFGAVELGQSHYASSHDVILVDGKGVVVRRGETILLYGAYRVATGDVVLFSAGSDGEYHLFFLVLRPAKKPWVLSAPDFYSANYTMEAKQQGDRVVVDLGFERGRRKTAELKNTTLTIRYAASDARIPIADCEWLYNITRTSCADIGSWHLDCEGAAPVGSRADLGNITVMSHHPGFNSTRLEGICSAICGGGQAPPLSVFATDVCGIK
jgi:hypothetical protein